MIIAFVTVRSKRPGDWQIVDGLVHALTCLAQERSINRFDIYMSIESVPLAKLKVPCGAVEPSW